MHIIDSHVHIGLKEFCLFSESNFKYDLFSSYEDVISLMNSYDIERVIALPIPHYQFDSKKSNDYVLKAYNKYPDRIIPFCRIDENLSDNLLYKGYRGVKLHLVYENFDIKNNVKNLQLIEDLNLPLIVHAKFQDKVSQIKRILDVAPNLTIILAHMGRGHLYTGEQVIKNAIGLKIYNNVYFETSTVGDNKSILNCSDIVGVDRIIYGSDYPFGKNFFGNKYDYVSGITMIESIFSKEDSEKILSLNVKKILNQSNSSQLQIRRVKKADLDKIMTIFNSLDTTDKIFLALDKKISLIRQVIRSERHCYVAVLEGEIIGFIRESGRKNNFSLLEEIVVCRNHRGKGVARHLLNYYHNVFHKNLAKTNAKNKAMIHLLEQNNYKADNLGATKIIHWVRESD